MRYTIFNDYNDYKNDIDTRFTIDDSYIICGCGGGFIGLLNCFPKIKIDYCLDAKANTINNFKFDVYNYEYLKNTNTDSLKFIITAGNEFYSEIKNTLLKYSCQIQNIISLPELLFFWGIKYKKAFISNQVSVIVLTNCNLRCKSCTHLVPYVKKTHYYSSSDVKKSIDSYFRVFSYVNDLVLCGGETFLYKELGEICDFIRDKYTDRYNRIKFLLTEHLFLKAKF